MKKKNLSMLILPLFMVFLLYSCAGAPEPVEPEPPVVEEIVEEPELEAEEEFPLPDSERAVAQALRQIAMAADLSDSDQALLQQAEDDYTAAGQAYGNDNKQARDLYVNAAVIYRSVLESRFAESFNEEKNLTMTEKEQAASIKADRAAPEPWQQGNRQAEAAEEAASEWNYPAAIESYQEARTLFSEAYTIAYEKREAAREALQQAQQTFSQTEETLRQEEEELREERSSAEEETREEYESADIEEEAE
jgi:hypothetical protein